MKNHKFDCTCSFCKAKRGELKHKDICGSCKAKRGGYKGSNNPMFGHKYTEETKKLMIEHHRKHFISCNCLTCKNIRKEPHKEDCRCISCVNKYNKVHKDGCRCFKCKALRGESRPKHKDDCKCYFCRAKRGEYIGKGNPSFNPNKTEFEKYKIACSFDFYFGDFTNEFDFYKVSHMYSSKKYSDGYVYVRDHMLSIFDGFKKCIKPEYKASS